MENKRGLQEPRGSEEEGLILSEEQALAVLRRAPELVAVASSVDIMDKIPEDRRIVMPWLKEGMIYLCTHECAKGIVEMSAAVLRLLKERNG